MSYALKPKIHQIMPLMIFLATSTMSLVGFFVPMMYLTMESQGLIATQGDKLRACLLAMIPSGFGEISGAIIIGKVIDKYKHRKAILFIQII